MQPKNVPELPPSITTTAIAHLAIAHMERIRRIQIVHGLQLTTEERHGLNYGYRDITDSL